MTSLRKGLPFASLMLALACSSQKGPAATEVGSASSALTADQCMYFDSNGRDLICHATGSAKHPYVQLNLSDSGCIDGHSQHPNDYIDVNGGSCNGSGCLPTGAPAGGPLACCSGNTSGSTCVCSNAGGACATDADCCSGATGACQNDTCAAACQPPGGPCLTLSDCCAGASVCNSNGVTPGTCIPTCPATIPITCPDGSTAGLCCGGNSAGCNGCPPPI